MLFQFYKSQKIGILTILKLNTMNKIIKNNKITYLTKFKILLIILFLMTKIVYLINYIMVSIIYKINQIKINLKIINKL